MSTGFVYVMINPAIQGLVKIGFSKKSSDERTKGLRGTGVPDDFIVVYDELPTACKLIETRLHKRFYEYRYRPNREFFQIPIRKAIRGVMEESVGFVVPRVGADGGVKILPDLKKKYPNYLKSDFHSIKITHSGGVVYLESVRYRYAGVKDEIFERTDLSFIAEDDSDMFQISRDPTENARLFVHQLDEYSLIQCTDLFAHDSCIDIERKHERS